MVCRLARRQVDGDERFGVNVDDVEHPVEDENAVRATQFVHHRLRRHPVERDDTTGARLRHQHGAVGGDGDADRGVQTRREDLDMTGPGRAHPAGALLDEDHIATGGDRHTVELVETVLR